MPSEGRPVLYKTKKDKEEGKEYNNLMRGNTNKKHACRYCKKELFQGSLGKHMIKHHAEDIKKMLKPYGTLMTPQAPFGTADCHICLVCKNVWDKPGYYAAHMKKHPECTVDAQLKAIYAFIGVHPHGTVSVKEYNYVTANDQQHTIRDLRIENKQVYSMLDKQPRDIKKTMELNQESIRAAYEMEISELRNRNLRLTNLIDYLNYKAGISYENVKDKISTLVLYISEVDKHNHYVGPVNDVLAKPISDEEYNTLYNLSICAGIDIDKDTNHVVFERRDYKELNAIIEPPAQESAEEHPALPDCVTETVIEPEIVVTEAVASEPVKPRASRLTDEDFKHYMKPDKDDMFDTHDNCAACGGSDEFYDLIDCDQCNEPVCIDNGIANCYLLECSNCTNRICLPCNRKNGASKIKPKCQRCS